jgi:hypothetical protein
VPVLVGRGGTVVVVSGRVVARRGVVVVNARGSRVRRTVVRSGSSRRANLDRGRLPRVASRGTVVLRGRRVVRLVVVLVRVRGGGSRGRVARVGGGVSGVRVARSRGSGGVDRRAVVRRRGADLDGDVGSGSPVGRRTDLAGSGGVESAGRTDNLALLEVDAGSTGGKEEAL